MIIEDLRNGNKKKATELPIGTYYYTNDNPQDLAVIVDDEQSYFFDDEDLLFTSNLHNQMVNVVRVGIQILKDGI